MSSNAVGLSQAAPSVRVTRLPMFSQASVVFECLAEVLPGWPPALFVDPVFLDAGVDSNMFNHIDIDSVMFLVFLKS